MTTPTVSMQVEKSRFWFSLLVLLSVLAITMIVLCVGWTALAPSRPLDWHETTFEGIAIVGCPRFVDQVQSALSLLEKEAPGAFTIVKNYVGLIEENERSGMWVHNDPPTYKMSQRTAYYSISWCASTIAHDSYHSALYHEYKQKHGLPVPINVWSGQQAEIKCNEHQIKALKKIGAPAHEIKHMASMDGMHFDLDGDGEYTWKDYWKRDW